MRRGGFRHDVAVVSIGVRMGLRGKGVDSSTVILLLVVDSSLEQSRCGYVGKDTSNIVWRGTTTSVVKDDTDAMSIVEESVRGWNQGQAEGGKQRPVKWCQTVSLQRRVPGVERVHPFAAWIPFFLIKRGCSTTAAQRSHRWCRPRGPFFLCAVDAPSFLAHLSCRPNPRYARHLLLAWQLRENVVSPTYTRNLVRPMHEVLSRAHDLHRTVQVKRRPKRARDHRWILPLRSCWTDGIYVARRCLPPSSLPTLRKR